MLLLFRILSVIICLGAPSAFLESAENQAVTYQLTGRLGNNLIAYFHAKWISYKYGLPLLYKPFPHAEDFVFHGLEQNIFAEREKSFDEKVLLENLSLLKIDYPNLLFVVPYFRDVGPQPEKKAPIRFLTDWDDPGFKEIIHSHLRPRRPLNCVLPPEGILSVLVHVRTGGDFDNAEVKLKMPLKFPPLSFYCNALRKLSNYYGHAPLYAFILTDDANPEQIAKKIKNQLPCRDNITFDWRKSANGHNINVLDDFFSIPNFKCLIRGDSTFSEMASRLGDYDVVVSPTKGHVQNGKAIIDAYEFKKRNL